MSREKFPGWLDHLGDEILPSYIGIIISDEIRIPINEPGFNFGAEKNTVWRLG